MPVGPIGRVWRNENRISSDGQTIEVPITNLIADAAGRLSELIGKLVKVNGAAKLNGIFTCGPFQKGREVTADCFDQVQLYHSLNSVQEYLSVLEIDVPQAIASQHNGKPHPIVAHANATDDLNAWYSPQGDDLTFGTNGTMSKGEDKWHLASCGDVTIHEGGHMTLDHINPKFARSWAGEGRAVHEGFSDVLPALYYDDPEVSEDFNPNVGRPAGKTDGLRNVDNTLTLSEVGSEEHSRGQVYSGFFWALKKRLPLTSRQAADTNLRLLFAHAFLYKTQRPKPADFVAAVVAGAEALAAAGKLAVDLNTLKTIINEEAKKRGLIEAAAKPVAAQEVFASVKEVERRFGPDGRIRFVLEQKNRHLGIERRLYQQQYKTDRFGYVNVTGHGIVEHRFPAKKAPLISTIDAKQIHPGKVDETLRIDVATALRLAMADAQSTLTGSREQKVKLEASLKAGVLKTKADLEKLSDVQMGHKMMQTAVAVLGFMGSHTIPPELVIMPDSDALHYKFKVGLGIYYINAKTGKARFERDVFVN